VLVKLSRAAIAGFLIAGSALFVLLSGLLGTHSRIGFALFELAMLALVVGIGTGAYRAKSKPTRGYDLRATLWIWSGAIAVMGLAMAILGDTVFGVVVIGFAVAFGGAGWLLAARKQKLGVPDSSP
jgi:hypothetical protein